MTAKKSPAQLDREIQDLLGQGLGTDAARAVRSLQRQGAALRKRFLGAKTDEAAQRDAIQYANDCRWRNPSPGANEAGKALWARGWLQFYRDRLASLRGEK